MKTAHDIIIRPVITEKSTADAAIGKYTFVVKPAATKPEIRQEIGRASCRETV